MAAAEGAVRPMISKKATYRADLLQEPEKDHINNSAPNTVDTQLVDVGKRLIAVSMTTHPQSAWDWANRVVTTGQGREAPRDARRPDRDKTLPSHSQGGIAGAVAKTVIAPLDRTKIIFQTNPQLKFTVNNVVDTLKMIKSTEGTRGLWRGNMATVMRVFPYAGIQFAAFDVYKRWAGADADGGQLSPHRRLLAGSAAGATAGGQPSRKFPPLPRQQSPPPL